MPQDIGEHRRNTLYNNPRSIAEREAKRSPPAVSEVGKLQAAHDKEMSDLNADQALKFDRIKDKHNAANFEDPRTKSGGGIPGEVAAAREAELEAARVKFKGQRDRLAMRHRDAMNALVRRSGAQ